MKPILSLLLASYNEERTIQKTIETLYAYASNCLTSYNVEIIVIDDGSNDGTYEALVDAAGKYSVIAEKNPVNMGQGAAFRRGFSRASGEVIITLDSDLSYPLEDIPKLLEKIEAGFNVVVASPFINPNSISNVPFIRHFLTIAGNKIYSSLIGAGIGCYTGSFRAYRTSAIQTITPFLKENRFTMQAEILLIAKEMGYPIAEIPSRLEWRKTGSRRSSFKVPANLKENLLFAAKVVFWK